jgi:two-component sensor histidine kinase
MVDPLEISDIGRSGRLAALTRTELLGAVPEHYFDRVTRLATRLLSSQTSLVSLVAENRQFFISACGLGEPYASTRETPLSHSFCKHVVVSKEPLIVTDARTMALLAKNLAVTELNVISYLGVPLSAHGEVIGALCVINNRPRDWTTDNVEVLTELAHVIEDEIALRELATTATGLAQQNATLAREYHHRVKNALAVSASLVALSGKDAVSVDDLISSARGRLNALANAHDALITNSDHVDLAELASKLLRPYVSSEAKSESAGPTVTLRNNQVTPICLFLHELATNSTKYGAFGHQGTVSVRWAYVGTDHVVLQWQESLLGGHQGGKDSFGSRLIEMAAQQMQGSCTTSWDEDTLKVSLQFPVQQA